MGQVVRAKASGVDLAHKFGKSRKSLPCLRLTQTVDREINFYWKLIP